MLALKIGNNTTKKKSSLTFLRVMLNENLSWKYHIETAENKLAKMLACHIA